LVVLTSVLVGIPAELVISAIALMMEPSAH
jgi:hypothetical protein